jgi:hypothetical protein
MQPEETQQSEQEMVFEDVNGIEDLIGMQGNHRVMS